MNKLAQYLNQHLMGEVVDDASSTELFMHDSSPLAIKPEMVVYPRNTNDIRKLLRFCWQLAEKGHKLSVTPRGSGLDATGGAIGSGVMLSVPTHMDKIFEYDGKQRLVRLQPGVSVGALQDALSLHGVRIPALGSLNRYATIGGVVASGRNQYEETPWVDQLEVILANGDVLQTKRLSKRELNKIKGTQSFEADIYRGVDGLIEDNRELIDSLDEANIAGYSAIKQVKRKDGSIDLSPLMFASQGTLGIISEMILKTEITSLKQRHVVAVFDDETKARDAIDNIDKFGVNSLEYYDELMIEKLLATGKQLALVSTSDKTGDDVLAPKAMLVALLTDSSDRVQAKKVKKLSKHLVSFGARVKASEDSEDNELTSLVNASTLALTSDEKGAFVPVADGMYVPIDRYEQFRTELTALAVKLRLELPVYGLPLEGTWFIRPHLNLKTTTGKQAALKLVEELARIAADCGGYLSGEMAEGRFQAYSTHKRFDDEVTKLYSDLKNIFDPEGILNSGVKQPADVRETLKALRSEYVTSHKNGLPRF